MDAVLICSSVRKRPEWAPLPARLLQGSNPRWKEATLNTHDVAMPFNPTRRQASATAFRAILLSPGEFGAEGTTERIERLYNLNGGQHVAIVFLMKASGNNSAVFSLMALQLELQGSLRVPIIPVASLDAVSASLSAFHMQISTGGGFRTKVQGTHALLPYCSDRQPLSGHTVNLLSDRTKDMKDLAQQATTSPGQEGLKECVGMADVVRIVNFWREEAAIDGN